MDTIYVATLYEYEEDMGRFYFTSQQKAEKFVADMSAGTDGEFYISEDSVDVPYSVPKSVWFCVDENYRVTIAYWTGVDMVEKYDEDEDICYVEVPYNNNRHIMEAIAIARAKDMLLERARCS